MPKLLDVMFLNHCSHEFSWPRRLQSGDCYQVCLLCGDQYGYDWKKMRRLDRLALRVTVSEAGLETRPKWLPRARRLQLSIPIKYREAGSPDWRDGEIRNISESGIFVTAAEPPSEKAPLEMTFEMPVQISGKNNSPVLCSGQVARMKTQDGDAKHVFAVAIMACKYLHNDIPAPPPVSKKIGGMTAMAVVKEARCRSERRR